MSLHFRMRPGVTAEQAELRLFCFHHAGGSAASFNAWHRALPGRVALERIQLPGRDPEAPVKPYTDVRRLVPDLLAEIRPLFDRPYAFYGHSLGALVAFELTRAVRAAGLSMPGLLVVSGRRAPQCPLAMQALCRLDEETLVARLVEMGGMADSLSTNLKWRRHFLPAMRADLEMSDFYEYREEAPLDCPLLAFRGEADPICTPAEHAAWAEQAAGRAEVATLPGRHFFTADGTSRLISTISDELGRI